MSFEINSPSDHDIPAEWQACSVMRHVSDPLSDEALGEEYKSWIDAGPVDFTQGKQFDIIKRAGEAPILPANMQSIIDNPHQLFISASRKLLSDKMFDRSSISFTCIVSSVGKGAMQIASRPHIDTNLEGVDSPETVQLRLVGFACNALPPDLLQGALKRDSLINGRLVNLRNLNNRFKREPIPINRLVITGPALLHEPNSALEPIVERRFMRWHLRA